MSHPAGKFEGHDLPVKQFLFLLSSMASSTLLMFPILQLENLLLFGRSPLVADANMMKFPLKPPGRQSGG
jgi:hypothetical protein